MLNLLNWDKPLMVNGKIYKNADEARASLSDFDGEVNIHLNYKETTQITPTEKPKRILADDHVPLYRIEVKQWMTKPGSPDFDFMIKWNKNQPMPMRRMYGVILQETKGMVKMMLHGRAEKDSTHCSHCLRPLTHPVSMFYGIGPICGGHMHMASPDEMSKIGEQYKIFEAADQKLRKVTWTGWIIKSAITSQQIVGKVKRIVEAS